MRADHWLLGDLERRLFEAEEERDRARNLAANLEFELTEALEELADVREKLAEARRNGLRVVP